MDHERKFQLELRGICKQFGSTRACQDLSFVLSSGEIVGLVGENGAGKSTMIKIIGGITQATAGQMVLNCLAYSPRSPADAQTQGVAIVPQELTVLPELPVWAGVVLSRIPTSSIGPIRLPIVNRKEAQRLCEAIFAELGVDIPSDVLVKFLSRAEKQLVEIAAAIASQPQLLILDEPTASLEQREVERLFSLLRRLRNRGYGIVIVSHKLDEIVEVSDRVLVIRDGRLVAEEVNQNLSVDSLAALVVGHQLVETVCHKCTPEKDAVMSIDGLAGGRLPDPVDLRLHRGQLIGVTGLLGSGASDLFRLLLGRTRSSRGTVTVHGRILRQRELGQRAILTAGVTYLPEDRRSEGLFPDLSISENILVACLPRVSSRARFLNKRRMKALSEELMRALNIVAPSHDTPVRMLSGGNQQKVLIARCLATQANVMLLEEPTHGVDIGTKWDIREIIQRLASDGSSILFRSTEAEEVLANSHEVIVFFKGAVIARLKADEEDKKTVVAYASGASPRQSVTS